MASESVKNRSLQRPSEPPNPLADVCWHKGSKPEQDAGPFGRRRIEGIDGVQPHTDALRARVDVPNQATLSSAQPYQQMKSGTRATDGRPITERSIDRGCERVPSCSIRRGCSAEMTIEGAD